MSNSKVLRFGGIGIVALVIWPALAVAGVTPRNGNFFVGYTDLLFPGGLEPKIERVYNSKSPFRGYFGWGWGNELEVRLSVAADGSVVVHEFGGGAENRFLPRAFDATELKAAVDRIVGAAKKGGLLNDQRQVDDYKLKLMTDATFRNEEWEYYRASGKLQERKLPVGTQLQSNRFSYQFITRVKDGYVRAFDNGRTEKFDNQGRYLGMRDRNGNSIELTYGRNDRLSKVEDNFHRKIFFSFDDRGLIEKIEADGGKIATYQYNEQGELILSKDTGGNAFRFKYSSDGRHNLIEIGYSDKTALAIQYYGKDQHENVRSLRARDSSVTDYVYKTDSSNRHHHFVTASTRSADGKVSASSYDYLLKATPDGDEWTYRLVATVDGDRTETIYGESHGLPVSIKREDGETAFAYDAKGHVTKKDTPKELTELTYDPAAGKVRKIVKSRKDDPGHKEWSSFGYDQRGNLVQANNSRGKAVHLFYDANGRIASLRDQRKHWLKFKYNENSKPVEIADSALGAISVSYTNGGQVKSIRSSGGRKIASQVNSTFQNFLEVIRPVSVSLSFQ